MKNYKIPVSYEMYGYVEVEAENLDEAINKAWSDDMPLPDSADYVDGSWQVDEDIAYELNDENPVPVDEKAFTFSVLDFELKDDDTDKGGIAFVGETVRDFIESLDYGDRPHNIDELNELLIDCGIKPLSID